MAHITCLKRGKEIVLKPEEAVRQLYLYKLIHEYGYPVSRIEVEFASSTEVMTSEEYIDTQTEEIDDELSLSDFEEDETEDLIISEESESMNEDEISESKSTDNKDSTDKELTEETEDTEETQTGATVAEYWNSEPIVGQSTNNGVTVSVYAPKESFPEGTVLHIDALTGAEAEAKTDVISKDIEATAFDISFVDLIAITLNGKTRR